MSTRNKQYLGITALFIAAGIILAVGLRSDPSPPVKVPDNIPKVAPPVVEGGEVVFRFGYDPKPQETREFVKSLPNPFLQDANPNLMQFGDNEPTLLYRALYEAYQHKYGKQWIVGAQGIGDCVSWAWAHCADIHLAVKWKLGDIDREAWKPAATESIYGGSRVEARGVSFGGYSDGSYGAAAAKFVKDYGVLFRQPYDTVDLSVYSSKRAKEWGAYGNGGKDDNGKLDEIATEHPITEVALVRSFEEAAAAIQAGYPVAVCSGQGFTSKRDKDGFCAPSGRWAHAMSFIAVRFDRPGLLCLNSWGPKAQSGPKWPDDQPDGSFWVDAKTATAMLKGGDSFAVSGYKGFPFRRLKHGSWVETKPAALPLIAETYYSLAP